MAYYYTTDENDRNLLVLGLVTVIQIKAYMDNIRLFKLVT